MSILPTCMYVCTACVPMPSDQKIVLDPLELKLQVVVNHHVDTGSRTWILYKNNKCFNYWAIFLACYYYILRFFVL